MSKRLPSWSFAVFLVLLVGGSILGFNLAARSFAARTGTGSQPTSGTPSVFTEGADLGGAPAPSFTLKDQNGATVTLEQLRGHPVVLTFFDSVCPHADCSLMAQYINWTAKDLGTQSADISWVALTVNPWHDTPASATAFLKTRQVTLPMRYLLGTPDEMAPLWKAYHMQAILQPDGVVIHTTGVYVIDAQGHERVYLDEGFDPQVLATYLHQLLRAPSSGGAGAVATAAPSSGEVNQSKTVSGTTVDLTATPGQFGTYTFTVTLQDAQGTPIQGATVTANLTMPAMVMQPVNVALPPLNPPVPGSYQAQGVLSMRGAWHVIVQVRLPNTGQAVQAAFDFTAAY
jgi:protein SCO1/2